MKKLVDSIKAVELLKHGRGMTAKFWASHVSLKRFAIALLGQDHSKAIYIVGSDCEHVTGQFSWKDSDITISVDQSQKYHIEDKIAGFHLICSSAAVFEGPAEVPPDPFIGFIGDEISKTPSGNE